MTASEPKNVIEALTAVMAELPGIGKDKKAAPAQGGYAYRGIEAITQHVQPLFAKYGVVFVPRVVSYEIRDITVNDKPWTDTVAMIEYDVYGPGGVEDRITVGPLLAIGRDNTDKGGNKVETQAFKYALLQVLCIADAKDDADAGSHEADPRAVASIDPTEMLRRDLGKVAKEEGIGAELAGALLVEKFGEGTTSKSLSIDQLRGAAASFKRYGNQRRKVELLRNQLELTEEGLLATAATILNLEADGVKSLDDLVMHEVDQLVIDLELRAALGKDMLEQDERVAPTS